MLEAYDVPVLCGDTVRAVVLDLAIVPDAALVPYLPLTAFTMRVDGELVGSTRYGDDPNAPESGRYGARMLRLHALCGTPEESVWPRSLGIAPGRHAVTVEAEILGEDSRPTAAEGDLVISCEGRSSLAPPEGELFTTHGDVGDRLVQIGSVGGALVGAGAGLVRFRRRRRERASATERRPLG